MRIPPYRLQLRSRPDNAGDSEVTQMVTFVNSGMPMPYCSHQSAGGIFVVDPSNEAPFH